MHESSKGLPLAVDEFEKAGLLREPCEVVKDPRVGEAGVSMECVLERASPTFGTDHLVIGRVVRFHARDELYGENDRIDVTKLDPWGVSSANTPGSRPSSSCPRRAS